MALVIDASVTLCWFFSAQSCALADNALTAARTDLILVPGLWWYEVRNVLIVYERKRKIREADTRGFLHDLAQMTILIDRAHDEKEIMSLARIHKLTVYDASYLELAIRENAQLATLDSELVRAAKAEKVTLLS
jgi:predicted nucleic acid-binding protein